MWSSWRVAVTSLAGVAALLRGSGVPAKLRVGARKAVDSKFLQHMHRTAFDRRTQRGVPERRLSFSNDSRTRLLFGEAIVPLRVA